jgi:hypothetical protein
VSVNAEQRFWPARLRWRLRGATMWPAFAAITLLNGILLHELPPIGTGIDLIPALLLATFGNLVLVGVIAPWLARRTLARQPAAAGGDVPPQARYELLVDRIGTGLLAFSVIGVVAAGLAAKPAVVSETKATEENANAIRDYVLRSGDAELVRNLDTANTIRLADGYFRTCIARDHRGLFHCFFVDTNRSPTRLVEDDSGESNTTYRVP